MQAELKPTAFSQACVDAVNDQINMEFLASYQYYAFSIYFAGQDVHFPNVAKFFEEASKEELKHGNMLVQYLVSRGVKATLANIAAPEQRDYTLLQAFQEAFSIEKKAHESIVNVHRIADKAGENHFMSFIEEKFLAEQIHEEDHYLRKIAMLKRVGKGLGEYLFDVHFDKD